MTIAHPVLVALGVVALSAAGALAAPPTDEQIEAALDPYAPTRPDVPSR